MTQGATFTLVNPSDDALFSTRQPKSDAIKTVKLSEDNLKAVGAYALKAIGGEVEIIEDEVGPGLRIGFATYRPGEWIIESYDHRTRTARFSRARLYDRVKYDLR